MPDMHSSIYSIMQDNLKSELKYYPVLGFSDAGFFSKKTLGLCHKPHKTLIIQNFALQSGYAAASIFRTLLRKAVCDRRIFLCGSLVRTLLRKAVCDRRIMVMTFVNESCLWQPHRLVRSVGQSILLRKTVYCQNFATQNRLFRTLLRKVVFDHRIYLCGS